MELQLQTIHALEIAGVDRDAWNAALQRGLVPWAPRTLNGVARMFQVDDLIAAFCLSQLCAHLIAPRFAWQIAAAIHRQIARDHSIMRTSAWRVTERGKPRVVVAEESPAAEAVELLRFDIAAIRVRMLDGVRAKLEQRAA